jgi:hypothetical protein
MEAAPELLELRYGGDTLTSGRERDHEVSYCQLIEGFPGAEISKVGQDTVVSARQGGSLGIPCCHFRSLSVQLDNHRMLSQKFKVVQRPATP